MSIFLPHGTTFSFGGTAVGKLIGVAIPAGTKGIVEETDTDSGYDRQWGPGLRNVEEFEIRFRYDPDDSGQQALQANYDKDPSSGTAKEECIITLPAYATTASGSQTITFDGFVTSDPSGDMDLTADENLELSCTVKPAAAKTVA